MTEDLKPVDVHKALLRVAVLETELQGVINVARALLARTPVAECVDEEWDDVVFMAERRLGDDGWVSARGIKRLRSYAEPAERRRS